jgi:CheY-like chemotaxis protein
MGPAKGWGSEGLVGILIVDDDEDVRQAVEEVLTDEGYETRGATNGKEAIAALEGADQRPDLILLDLMMPVMDGWDFLFWLDERPDLRDTPVAIMSAHPSIQRAFDIARARRGAPELRLHGGNRLLLPKPLSFLRLLSIARETSSRSPKESDRPGKSGLRARVAADPDEVIRGKTRFGR